MRFAVIAAGLALLIVQPALAQTKPDAPDAVRLDLARQLVNASGGAKQFETQIDAMYGAMYSKMAEGLPEDQKGSLLVIQKSMRKEMHTLIPPIIDISARLYATDFTEQELRDILAFQRSPSGQSMIHKMPEVTRQAIVEMVPLIMADMPKLMHAVTRDVCDEQHCTPEQQKVLEAALDSALSPKTVPAPTPGF